MATAHTPDTTRRHVTPRPLASSTPCLLPRLLKTRSNAPACPAEAEAEAEAMAGGGLLPLDLSLATAGASASAGERRRAGQRGHRRTVSALFAELGAMLPNDLLPNRPASREEIVDAAAKQVKVLEETAGVLETYRAVRRAGAGAAPRAEVAVAVGTVCFCARLPRPGSLTRVLEAFHRRGVEVLVATVVCHGHGGAAVVTVTAAAAAPEVLELIRADIAGIY
ncbi:uncharacterized protein LOC120701544 [Panicum virgatum]|uniref:BHLH domain-containing protein n=1 Tax=Panicum virgatum TaxID=38727 RepID=A0A8T0VD35_PANVG|nr:uncharacterized protein LOC120701544 [Panicum virgatum]KAG2629729.1 hypothetical protein PVAP13_3KG448600 [Panicum virgatum]